MAYLGNLNGPRESVVVSVLGAEFFGISAVTLESEIEFYSDAERRNEVQPVHIDEDGCPYIELQKGREPFRCILEEHGWTLSGDIVTFTTEESDRWKRRTQTVVAPPRQ